MRGVLGIARFFVAFIFLTSFLVATTAQTQSPTGRKRLTVVCYWQNRIAFFIDRFALAAGLKVSDEDPYGCKKYKDPTHCLRTGAEMMDDTKHYWERVTADGLIYTISCKHDCKRWPTPGQSYDAETYGNFMWITFETPDNKNPVQLFEIFDVAPMKEEEKAPPQSSEGPAESASIKVGTAFFVSEHGYVLTNAHVVSGCKQIRTRDGHAAYLVSKDDKIDLALLRVEVESPAIASFRAQPEPRIGDSVIAFGFPLQGLLSSEANLATGTVSATTGMGDDPRFMQMLLILR